jgi:hypothetical protein
MALCLIKQEICVFIASCLVKYRENFRFSFSFTPQQQHKKRFKFPISIKREGHFKFTAGHHADREVLGSFFASADTGVANYFYSGGRRELGEDISKKFRAGERRKKNFLVNYSVTICWKLQNFTHSPTAATQLPLFPGKDWTITKTTQNLSGGRPVTSK